ncbi:MAG TPA: carbohydrate kinase family protein [Streptosporangiaceae bacterium]
MDLLVLAELNPDVLVSSGDVEVRFGQVEQLVDNATITLGSSGAITACAAAAQGLDVAVCAVVGDDPIGEWTTDLLRGHGVDVSGVIRRPGLRTGLSVVLTRADGDRAILTYGGAMTELSAADVPQARLRDARHVHASSYFLQRGLQAGLPELFAAARAAGATTSLDTGWAPRGEWSSVGPVLHHLDYLLPNAAECAHLAAAFDPALDLVLDPVPDPAGSGARDADGMPLLPAALVLHRLGPDVAVKLGAEGAIAVGREGGTRVHGRPVRPVDTTGAGDCFNAGFLAGILDGAAVPEALRRAVASGSLAVTGWGGTGRLASRAEAVENGAQLAMQQLPVA